MWKKYGRARQASNVNIIRHKATRTHAHTHTHSEYTVLITFSRQQWLRQRPSALRLYVQCQSCVCFFVKPIVDFEAMLSAWSSHAVFRKSLLSEMRRRHQTRRRPIQEDSILSHLCLEFRLRIFTGVNGNLLLFVQSLEFMSEKKA
jgi:hypothetical protein